MKRLILVFIIVCGAFLTGCNKQYTCECKITGGSTSNFVITSTKQSDAASKCSSYSSSSSGSAPTTCSLK